MVLLEARHLESEDAELLRGVSLALRQGERVGLVGSNGAGKTHLLRILAGDLSAAAGSVRRGPGMRLSFVRQAQPPDTRSLFDVAKDALEPLRERERALRLEERLLAEGKGSLARYADLTSAFESAGGYQAEADLAKTLIGLGIKETQFSQSAASLSGGERMRLALAAALGAHPDILLLDEPSNHLDLSARRFLADRLAVFPGALLMASHDRALLDAVCTHIAQLAGGQLELYRGSYSRFETQRQHARRNAHKRARVAQQERLRLEAAQQRLQDWGTPKAQRRRKAIGQRLPELVPALETSRTNFELTPTETRGTLLYAEHLSKAFGGKAVVTDASFRIESGDKIALVGPNGAGKSTFLALIAGEHETDDPRAQMVWHPDAKLALFDQQSRGVDEHAAPLTQVERFVSRPRAEQLLALVGVPPGRWHSLPSKLSGGERARLGLALLIAGEANMLLLDEPTNDLDIAMIETLEASLADTDAAFILVTHDARLIERVATRVWSLEAGELTEYRGGLGGYVQGTRRREGPAEPLTAAPAPPPEETPQAKLERLEDERTQLETRLLDPLALSERERLRLERRYLELFDALSLLYDARLPPPMAAYRAHNGGVTVTTDGPSEAVSLFDVSGAFRYKLVQQARIGHLALLEPDDACSLAWARRAALSGVTRLAFEHLGLKVLQMQTRDDVSSLGFEQAEGGWWVLSSRRYEARLGYFL